MILTPILLRWYGFLNGRFPGTAMRMVVSRMACDQLIWAPIFMFTFFPLLNMSRGMTLSESIKETGDRVGPALKVRLAATAAAQLPAPAAQRPTERERVLCWPDIADQLLPVAGVQRAQLPLRPAAIPGPRNHVHGDSLERLAEPHRAAQGRGEAAGQRDLECICKPRVPRPPSVKVASAVLHVRASDQAKPCREPSEALCAASTPAETSRRCESPPQHREERPTCRMCASLRALCPSDGALMLRLGRARRQSSAGWRSDAGLGHP